MPKGTLGAVAAAISVLLSYAPAHGETVKVGSLRTSSGSIVIIGQQRGYFEAEGLTVELVNFDAAEPVAVAVTSGSIDFGVTGMTAGLYSLGGQGAIRIISGQIQEHPTFRGSAIVASNRAWDAGLKSFKDFGGKSIGVTQVGSALHYSIALIADKYGVDLRTIRIVPLQANANVATAVTGGQVDAAAVLGSFAIPGSQRGDVKLLGWVGDETPWQFGAVIAATKFTNEHTDTVKRFLVAFHKAQRDYHDAFTAPDGTRHDEADAINVLPIVAAYVGQAIEQVRPAIAYVDGAGRVDIKDVLHQIAWYRAQGFIKNEVDGNVLLDKRFVVPMPER